MARINITPHHVVSRYFPDAEFRAFFKAAEDIQKMLLGIGLKNPVIFGETIFNVLSGSPVREFNVAVNLNQDTKKFRRLFETAVAMDKEQPDTPWGTKFIDETIVLNAEEVARRLGARGKIDCRLLDTEEDVSKRGFTVVYSQGEGYP